MGHVGLTPQSATVLGGFKAQGQTADAGRSGSYDDAVALEAAGCFAVVLEAVPAPVAARITRSADGADDRDRRRRRRRTARCSSTTTCSASTKASAPRFVKRYADLAAEIRDALERYAADVR